MVLRFSVILGLLRPTKGDGPQDHGPGTLNRGPCALDHGL